MVAGVEARIEELEKKLKQAKALAAKKKAAERAKVAKAERAKDTRKKVLVGAWVMDGGDPISLLNAKGQSLENWLTRDEERALFGLAPKAE